MMTEDPEEKEPEIPTTDPATTQVPRTKTEIEGDAMMTEEEEIKDEGTEEADQDPKAEIVSAKKDQQGTTRTTRASTSQARIQACLLYTSPSPRDLSTSRMPSSA